MTEIKPKRIVYIDFLRAWAVVFMIFWHTIDALLQNSLKQGSVFPIAQFLGGLVAPSFIFTAGCSFAIILSKRKDDFLYFRKSAFKQLYRIFQILVIAYLLHFPFEIIVKYTFSINSVQYINFVKSDVLHIIALGLLLLQLLIFILRKDVLFNYSILVLSIVIIVLTPYIYEYDFSKIFPLEIATFFNRRNNSIFPLFPWLSYLFIGYIVMYYLLKFSKEGKELVILKRLFYLGIGLILLGLIPELSGFQTTSYYNFWLTSPNIFVIKIGIVLVIIYLLHILDSSYHYKMKIFGIFGLESLFAYVSHLLLVYGTDSPITLSHYLGGKCDWILYFIIYFVFLFFILLLTKTYSKYKASRVKK